MSKISDVYDTILTTVGTLFPSKTRIPNPYLIEDNPIQYLEDGYGVRIFPESPAPSEYCRFSRTRIFSIVLSKEVITTDIQTIQYDTTAKELLEEVYTLQKDFLNPDQLGIEDKVEKIEMGGTGPIELFKGDKVDILTMDVLFQVQITDDI